ncbi:uncharacterized protein MEPE_06604 [Melanopsichium pennsylvanicum]|uniref:Uncharacterized protein n=2 Tax=Melanopsichium pennsylvanicum TaxID=63383 RepID=A0AAJ4XUF8_9BASI|nr:uncharacterized protein MEPE_06604 [Melanopsichium pennsylvanicum]
MSRSTAFGYNCTWDNPVRKCASSLKHVKALKARITKLEKLIARLAPGTDFTDLLGKPVTPMDDEEIKTETKSASAPEFFSSRSNVPQSSYTSLCGAGNMAAPNDAPLSSEASPSCIEVAADRRHLHQTSSDVEDAEDNILFIESELMAATLDSRIVDASTLAYHAYDAR